MALSPCRTVTLSMALGNPASPLRTGTPAGTRKSSLRHRASSHLQGATTPIILPPPPPADNHKQCSGHRQQQHQGPPGLSLLHVSGAAH
ncbi:hypothetical protein GDO81_013875 [Engystomops pustulosus]|uniref:Uncharacterized protein n=1 Tax=Engystomops pustulosus TaxID=76066 RepID=A0AAV7B6B5_ENGPU|nr:hypothetical protein GDO81_013875 [Engystomops pustulosus]